MWGRALQNLQESESDKVAFDQLEYQTWLLETFHSALRLA